MIGGVGESGEDGWVWASPTEYRNCSPPDPLYGEVASASLATIPVKRQVDMKVKVGRNELKRWKLLGEKANNWTFCRVCGIDLESKRLNRVSPLQETFGNYCGDSIYTLSISLSFSLSHTHTQAHARTLVLIQRKHPHTHTLTQECATPYSHSVCGSERSTGQLSPTAGSITWAHSNCSAFKI